MGQGDDHRDNPRQERVFPRYIEAIFLFTLRFVQVDFENEIQFIIVNNFSETLGKVTHRIRMFRFQHCLHETG